MEVFKSNGKILLTSEYLVLDGALSLALPTKLGQSLEVLEIGSNIKWTSYDYKQNKWFSDELFYSKKTGFKSTLPKNKISKRLVEIFNAISFLNKSIFKESFGYEFKTKLEFSIDWGLGSSSTLINNLASWSKVDPYELLKLTFQGSGYDIACAKESSAITYQIINSSPKIKTIDFNPKFKKNLFFIYLRKKQNSRKGIKLYNKTKQNIGKYIIQINNITKKIVETERLIEFEKLIESHEKIISKILNIKPIQKRIFEDYNGGIIKSLGAWGGDFILVTSASKDLNYFLKKGYNIIFKYDDLIK